MASLPCNICGREVSGTAFIHVRGSPRIDEQVGEELMDPATGRDVRIAGAEGAVTMIICEDCKPDYLAHSPGAAPSRR
jgi:hypothetical protein